MTPKQRLEIERDRRRPGGDRYELMRQTRRVYTFVSWTILTGGQH